MEIKSLKRVGEYEWEIPKTGGMRVSGRIFASKRLIEEMDEKVKEQVTNVACLPGIVRASMAMPDAHWGYGFPIGGVAAFDPEAGGIISVGGVGYDISCGVRCLRTGLKREEVNPVLEELVDALFATIPSGVGSEGRIRLSVNQLDEVLTGGARWAVAKGYGEPEDLDYIEERGCLPGADPDCVSLEAKRRQHRQVGTLGSGNHYLEIQYVAEIYDRRVAEAFGLEEGDVIISIHCGSRALGHQIATDYLKVLAKAAKKYGIPIREKELVCAPINSPEGERYYRAMACGVNCALANRLPACCIRELQVSVHIGVTCRITH
jgi:tRNA-splicing ligase RtcB